MRSVTAPDGVALAVHEHGGAGRPTLFCHATGFHGAVWEPMSAALGDGFERWAIDFRAHGASVVPPGTPAALGRRCVTTCWRWSTTSTSSPADAARHRPLDGRRRPAPRRAGPTRDLRRPLALRADRPADRRHPGRSTATTRSPTEPGGGVRRSRRTRRRWPTSRPSRRSTWPAPTRSTPTSATGWWPARTAPSHLACRPDDEARLYEGGAAHGAFDHLDEVRVPRRRRLRRRADRTGHRSASPPPRRSPRAGSRCTSTSPTSVPSRPPPSSPRRSGRSSPAL